MIGQQKSYMHRNVLNTDDFFVGGIYIYFFKRYVIGAQYIYYKS